jgi:hypothetical protein
MDMDAGERAHRVAVTEAPPAGASPDYGDAFAVGRRAGDGRSAERWARDGFGRLPRVTREGGLLAHRGPLGFSLGPWDSPDHVFGWRIASSEPELLHLEARGRWLSGHMLWRLEDARLTMTTFVRYEMPRTGRAVWTTLGGLHRGSTPHLLRLAASAPGAA